MVLFVNIRGFMRLCQRSRWGLFRQWQATCRSSLDLVLWRWLKWRGSGFALWKRQTSNMDKTAFQHENWTSSRKALRLGLYARVGECDEQCHTYQPGGPAFWSMSALNVYSGPRHDQERRATVQQICVFTESIPVAIYKELLWQHGRSACGDKGKLTWMDEDISRAALGPR